MSSNHNVEMRAVEKDLLRPCLKQYNAKEKQHFVGKHMKVNRDQLSDFEEKDTLFTLTLSVEQEVKSKKTKVIARLE